MEYRWALYCFILFYLLMLIFHFDDAMLSIFRCHHYADTLMRYAMLSLIAISFLIFAISRFDAFISLMPSSLFSLPLIWCWCQLLLMPIIFFRCHFSFRWFSPCQHKNITWLSCCFRFFFFFFATRCFRAMMIFSFQRFRWWLFSRRHWYFRYADFSLSSLFDSFR